MKKWIEIPTIKLYSDGGADPNPGRGGFGVILSYKGRKKEFYQGYEFTTNNRMELMGVIFGLEQLKTKSNVQVYTDSKYVINGITNGWAENWKKNNWFRDKKNKAVNIDLWDKLLTVLKDYNVEFQWVKGHSGHPENERCDALANLGIHSENLLEDVGYESKGKRPQKEKSKVSYYFPTAKKRKINQEGDKCRKCDSRVIKKTRKKTKKIKPHQNYYYEYILQCPGCNTIYMTEDAKREIIKGNDLFDQLI
ncbi:MAG: ribonuclease HI [Bacteroidota bacterium]